MPKWGNTLSIRILTISETMLKLLVSFILFDSLVSAKLLDSIKNKPLKYRIVPQISGFSGHPYLKNCAPNKTDALKMPFLIKNDLTLFPRWSNRKEFEEHPDVLNYYEWSYKATRTDVDPETDEISHSSHDFDIMAHESGESGKIYFPAHTARPGLYTVALLLRTERRMNSPNHRTCYFYVRPAPPVPLIEGGTFRVIPENVSLTVSGRDSLDPNRPDGSGKSLKFQWTCSQKLSSDVCSTTPLSTTPEFIIPPQKILAGDKITVRLRVQNEYGVTRAATQELEIRSNAVGLKIRCVKNCPPLTDVPNVEEATFLQAVCETNCEAVEEELYRWRIGSLKATGSRFVIPPNNLQPSTHYVIRLTLQQGTRFGLTTSGIYYAGRPEVSKCEILPHTGRSLVTLFRLECEEKSPDRNHFYELYVDSPGVNTITSGFYPDVFETNFILPPSRGHVFGVRVSKIGIGRYRGPSVSLEVVSEVLPIIQRKPTEEIPKLLYKESGRINFEKVRPLVLEILNDRRQTKRIPKNYIKSLAYEILQNILESRVARIPEVIELTDSVSKLVKGDELTQGDPLLGEMVSGACKTMVERVFEGMENKKVDQVTLDRINMLESTLFDCMEAALPAESYDLLAHVTHNITVPEIPPNVLDVRIKDNIPDYVDHFENYSLTLDQLHQTTKNVFDATALAAKALANSMNPGEDFARRSGNFSATVVAKDEGRRLASTRIQLLDTVLIPSRDFAQSDHSFDILMSTWTKDVLWWNVKRTHVATNVINVQFWHSSCKKRIRHFNDTVSISFQIKNRTLFRAEEVRANISIPENFFDLNRTELNKYIRVFRIDFPKNSVLRVTFHSIPASVSLEVVARSFEFPTIDNFDRFKRTITGNHSTIITSNHHSYSKWIYFGVLPKRNSLTQKKPKMLYFNISFVLSYCIHWFEEERTWRLDCRAEKTLTPDTIGCQCRHFSVLAGYLQNMRGLVQEIHTIDIEMELQVYYVIFATIIVTYAFYGILLLSSLFRTRSGIYFLADNKREHMYAYLVIVRTDENIRSAGTTSNIVIRLIGSKSATEAHVLNYPDPKLRLLQKDGADTFVLTTAASLGTMRSIELWFDCEGPSPSWSCRDVVIYDMQTREQWFFRIRSWLSLSRSGTHYLRIAPTDKEPPGFCNQFRVCNHFHTWQLWAREGNFSYIARLTTVFSNALMNFVFVLMMMGIPDMHLRDCFDPHAVYRITWYHVHVAAVCAFASFVIHVIIAWIYRFSDITFTVRDRKYNLSHTFSWSMWVLLALIITFSSSFLLWYGFWLPTTSSYVWLTCCIGGLLIDIILYENIFITIQTFFCKFKLEINLDKKFNWILQNIDGQRQYLYEKFGNELLRPYLGHLHQRLERMEIIRKGLIAKLRNIIYNDLEDLVFYSVYNILLTVLVLLHKDPLTVITQEEILSMIEGKHTRTLAFSEIKSIKQVITYINETLIPVIHPVTWYWNYPVLNDELMIDNSNKHIGVVRFRQHRIVANECSIPEAMSFLNVETCWQEFSFASAETGNFGPRWSLEITTAAYDRFQDIWKYLSAEKSDTKSIVGQIATYSGGGYVAFLGRTLHNSYTNLQRFVEMLWIDRNTRSIFIEFLTYNANHNMFVAVRLLFEESVTGYVRSSKEVNVNRMLFAGNEYEQAPIIFSILYICWWAILMLKLIVGVYKYFFTIYKRFWLMIDLIINVTTLVCIILFLRRIQEVQAYLESSEKVKYNQFVSYFGLLNTEDLLTYFNAFLILVATARLWRFLRFNLFFRIMERTLTMAAYPLLGVTFAFAIILTAFGLTGIIIFRDEFEELGFFMKIVATLIQMSLKPDQFDLSQYIVFQTAYYYFSVYLLVMQVILLLYVTVIIMAYMKAQLECSVGPDRYTVHDYLSEQAEYLPKLVRTKITRLRGGRAEDLVTSKADEFRYANSVQVCKSRMKSMGFIVSCIIRNINEHEEERRILTAHEIQMMLGVVNIFVLRSYEDDEVEFFFKGHFEGQNIQLIDEKRIDKIAEFSRLMLRRKGERERDAAPKADQKLVTMSQMIRRQNRALYQCRLLLMLASFQLDDVAEGLTQELQE